MSTLTSRFMVRAITLLASFVSSAGAFSASCLLTTLLLPPASFAARTDAASVELTAEMTIVPDVPLDSCSEMLTPLGGETPRVASGFAARLLPFPGQGRMFGVIPNYRAAQYQENYKPLTPKEKFEIARKDSFDWPNFPLLAGYALQAQVASGGFRNNGGVPGFFQFYGRAFGDQIVGAYITEALLPSLLHEDPRFFRLGTGSFLHRAAHAASSIVMTPTPSGHMQFNLSEVVGNMGVVAITTAYYPASQSAPEAAERWGMALGNDLISNILTEFWPDVRRRVVPRLLLGITHHPQAK
jgi:hypothetical protein